MIGGRPARLARSLSRIARTHYPSFSVGLMLGDDRLPAFVYHDVREDEFEADLTFLVENGYQTLSTEEFAARKKNEASGKGVLLTFDDGRRNFFDVVFPLLKRYRSKATLFVPTRWISPAVSTDSTVSAAASTVGFMAWDELRTCLESGLVDVQSHAHRHALVYVSQKLVGFASPDTLARYDIYDWPMRREGGRDILGPPPCGTPIYEARPLLSATRRVLEVEEASRLCQAYVEEKGGRHFFAQRHWERELREVHEKATRRTTAPPALSGAALSRVVASEFEHSMELFEGNLGLVPKFLAYPWFLGSEESLAMCEEYGFQAVFGVGFDYRRARRMRGTLDAYGRMKGEWLRLLPGRGRSTVVSVVASKLRDFGRSQHLAH